MTGELVAGRYRLGELIGTGGMGRVWLADDEVLRRHVAIKEVLLPDSLTEEELQELRLRTLREARAAARLSHPNVVRIYDVLYAGQRPWIVMEYLRGRSLAHVIKQSGPLSPAQAARMGLSVCAALSAAHAAGVLHRDVKPGNVLLGDEGRVVLTDFGLATYDEIGVTLTQPGIIHGSPQFIAPERAQDGTSSPAADMWSLGATLYAAVEGHSPYSRPTSMATLTALATAPPDPPRQAGSLKPVLMGLLRRNPRARMTPDEVITRLQRIVARNDRGQLRLPPRQPAAPTGAEPPDVLPSDALPSDAALPVAGAAPPINAPLAGAPLAGSLPEGETGTGPSYPTSPPPAWPPLRGPDPDEVPTGAPVPTEMPVPVAGMAPSGKPPAPRNRRTFDPAPVSTAWPAEDFAPGGEIISGRLAAADDPLTIYPEKSATRTTSEFDSDAFLYDPHAARSRRRIGPWVRAALIVLPLLLIGTAIVAEVASTGTRGATATSSTRPPLPVLAATWPCRPGTPGASTPATPVPSSTHLVGGLRLPPNWVWYDDPSGFQIAVPAGWVMSRSADTVCFRDPGSGRTLGVYMWTPPISKPVDALKSQEVSLIANGGLPGYQRKRIQAVPFLAECAEWEYTYQGSGGPWHVIVRDDVTPTGRGYAVSWLTTEFDWISNRPNYDLIATSFEPPSP